MIDILHYTFTDVGVISVFVKRFLLNNLLTINNNSDSSKSESFVGVDTGKQSKFKKKSKNPSIKV